MALRVLLADESSTIKKVMQLALQDFGVEVKAVAVGLDVLEVARNFQPDVIFADVLLSKKNGYEVCAELKSDIKLHKTPVVLMWSGFMEIDEKKVSMAAPDARLEKPFDADTLRNIVRNLVPRLQKNIISQYLRFPNLPEIQDEPAAKTRPQVNVAPPTEPVIPVEAEEIEEFQNVPLPKIKEKTPTPPPTGKDSREDWATKDLSQWRLDIPEEDLTLGYKKASDSVSSDSSFEMTDGLLDSSMELEPIGMDLNIDPPTKNPAPTKPQAAQAQAKAVAQPAQMVQLSHERVEQILREEVKAAIEGIAWKIIPEIAERIVREEIQKLMKDAESL